MGLFSSPKPQSTISDKDYKKIQDRAHKAHPNSFSKKAVDQRKASKNQRGKSVWS